MSEFRAGSGAERTVASLRSASRRRTADRSHIAQPAPQSAFSAPLPWELAAFQGLLDPQVLEAAARRAGRFSVGGDEVLLSQGIVSADFLTQTLARQLGIQSDSLEDDIPPHSPRLLQAALSGVLSRNTAEGKPVLTVAPRGIAFRRLAQSIRENPKLRQHLRLTSPERLSSHIRRAGSTELAHEAVLGLYTSRPDLSAANRARHPLRWFAIAAVIALVIFGLTMPGELLLIVEYFLGVSFLTWIGLRLLSCIVRPRQQELLEIPDRGLPVYSIIVPLYREANMVQQLVASLRKLNYPPEKLDIKFVLEPDDTETQIAVGSMNLSAPFEVIVTPHAGPKTKPKALATALPFVRGSFVVVYDAEDEPERDQLRIALSAFLDGPQSLACVQARLAVNNATESWLSRQFAAEYAGLFDVFLPALACLKLPLPLGGTSNHFRTSALRQAGGWDPFNVTEDADLGMRLYRFGFHTDVIGSTTWEEAPVRFGQWLRQRTRWFKGWMRLVNQTDFMNLFNELRLTVPWRISSIATSSQLTEKFVR